MKGLLIILETEPLSTWQIISPWYSRMYNMISSHGKPLIPMKCWLSQVHLKVIFERSFNSEEILQIKWEYMAAKEMLLKC